MSHLKLNDYTLIIHVTVLLTYVSLTISLLMCLCDKILLFMNCMALGMPLQLSEPWFLCIECDCFLMSKDNM